ncbi:MULTISPECIES: hypothetical protein [unclassified Streptomyces]|uniref:hypothetical protein n=1 Tax=unclassified Streptomyces TaxID=2593676 RepID=UPI00341829FB
MSRGERTPGETGGDEPAVPDEPAPAAGFAVVISGDGTAAIDGEPVPSADGVTVDAAILDALHGYARDRGTTVTATISDPAAGYVAFVEVAPDGSSTLVDQREQPSAPPAVADAQEPPERPERPGPPTAPGAGIESDAHAAGARADAGRDDHVHGGTEADAGPDGQVYGEDEDGPDALVYGEDEDGYPTEDEYPAEAEVDDEDDDFDMEAYTLEQQRLRESVPPPPPPAATPAPAPESRPAPHLVRRAGARQSDDEYKGPGLLHRPLVVGPVALVAAALVIVPLVMLGTGGSQDGGHRQEAARSSDESSASPQADRSGPVATASVSAPPSSGASASPSASPKKPKGAKGSKGSKGSGGSDGPGSGGGVTVTVTAQPPRATVTAAPAQDTAATAVNRLARNDPSGRHICYRAYVSGQGWQKPVCDGTMAGTSGRNSPIKALNIAVSGGGGSAANAFVHKPGSTDGRGTWEPRWTAVIADGRNNYIGSTKKSAPVMSGFAINIGSGRICQTAKVHGFDWGAQGCADARPGYVFGGALENDRWLEAVKFTV